MGGNPWSVGLVGSISALQMTMTQEIPVTYAVIKAVKLQVPDP